MVLSHQSDAFRHPQYIRLPLSVPHHLLIQYHRAVNRKILLSVHQRPTSIDTNRVFFNINSFSQALDWDSSSEKSSHHMRNGSPDSDYVADCVDVHTCICCAGKTLSLVLGSETVDVNRFQKAQLQPLILFPAAILLPSSTFLQSSRNGIPIIPVSR